MVYRVGAAVVLGAVGAGVWVDVIVVWFVAMCFGASGVCCPVPLPNQSAGNKHNATNRDAPGRRQCRVPNAVGCASMRARAMLAWRAAWRACCADEW